MNNQDELERLLGTELHQRVDHMSDAPLGLGDVKGRAGRIRRNRRIAAGVGVAAAVAIIAPVAMLVAPGANNSTEPPVAPPEPSRRDIHTTLTLDGLPVGAAPTIEYFTTDGVVLPDQGFQPLDERYQAMIENPAMGGWSAVGPSADELVDLTADFERTSARAMNQSIVTTADRSRIAFVAPEAGAQTLLVWDTTDAEAAKGWDFPASPLIFPVGFLDDQTVLYTTYDRDGSSIGIAEADGSTREITGSFLRPIATHSDTGFVSVMTKSNEDGSGCFGIVDVRADADAPLWETCDYSLGSFSPDGQYVLASDAYQSGAGKPSLTILDVDTGSLLATFTQNARGDQTPIELVNIAWESTDTVIATATEAGDARIVRFGTDGTLETIVPPQEIKADLPFWLGRDRTQSW